VPEFAIERKLALVERLSLEHGRLPARNGKIENGDIEEIYLARMQSEKVASPHRGAAVLDGRSKEDVEIHSYRDGREIAERLGDLVNARTLPEGVQHCLIARLEAEL
jgi:hypothetical protein